MAARYAAGDDVEDHCPFCGMVRRHQVSIADGDGRAVRVVCDGCQSEHRFSGPQPQASPPPALEAPSRAPRASRGARDEREAFPLVSERERRYPKLSLGPEVSTSDLELLLRRVLREECGLTPAVPAEKWKGGEIVLRPGRPGVQEKTLPIETFFHKVVMIRNRLRSLEQQVNSTTGLSDEARLKLQGYITGCYGSLTSFNVLFAEEEDQFKGAGAE